MPPREVRRGDAPHPDTDADGAQLRRGRRAGAGPRRGRLYEKALPARRALGARARASAPLAGAGRHEEGHRGQGLQARHRREGGLAARQHNRPQPDGIFDTRGARAPHGPHGLARRAAAQDMGARELRHAHGRRTHVAPPQEARRRKEAHALRADAARARLQADMGGGRI